MIRLAAFVFCLSLASTWVAAAPPAADGAGAGLQAVASASSASQPASGKEILTGKCFQCHQASMWTSLRQDRKAWEAVLYRMVGRGALWTEQEISAMADFLAQTRGPN
jgi:hypothetical protein